MARKPVSGRKREKSNEISNSAEDGRAKPDVAWIRARLKERRGQMTYAEIAERFGTAEYIVKRMLAGTRHNQPNELIQWAELLDVSIVVVLNKFGHVVPFATVPIIGKVRANGRISEVLEGKLDTVPMPSDAVSNMEGAKALLVEAPNSGLAQWDGSILYYVPGDEVQLAAFGRLSVVTFVDEPAQVVGVLDRASEWRNARLTIFGGRDELTDKRLLSASPVRWIKL